MKKNFIKGIGLVMAIMLSMFVFTSCGAKVSSIAITKLPDKTQYIVGEEFSAEGGEVTATLSDGSSKKVPLTDPEVQLGKVSIAVPDGKMTSEKTITVTYGGKRARFAIKVSVKTYTVSFSLGYENAPDFGKVIVKEGALISAPEGEDKYSFAPTREGFQFEGWYTDIGLTTAFDPLKDSVSEDITLHAKWLDVSAVYLTLTLKTNYYGATQDSTLQKVKEGEKATSPIKNPTRTGYTFKGWYTLADGGSVFSFDKILTKDETIYAQWTRSVSGAKTYILEGESIDFAGKQGAGYSGNPGGVDMIQSDITGTASKGLFIGYNYKPDMQHDFLFASDKAINDAKIVIRLSAEFKNMTLTPEMFSVSLNGIALNYGQIKLDKVPADWGAIMPFEDFVLTTNAALKEGANSLVITITNNDNWLGEGAGTIAATAPLIDCFKITTEAVIIWDGTFGLPHKNV